MRIREILSEAVDTREAYEEAVRILDHCFSHYDKQQRKNYSILKSDLRYFFDELLRKIGDAKYPVQIVFDYVKDGDTTGALAFAGRRRDQPRIVIELSTLMRSHGDDRQALIRKVARTFAHEFTHYIHNVKANLHPNVDYAYNRRVGAQTARRDAYLASGSEIHAYSVNAAREILDARGSFAGVAEMLKTGDTEELARSSEAFRRYHAQRQRGNAGVRIYREFIRQLLRQMEMMHG